MSADPTAPAASLPVAGLPATDPAREPAAIRNGDPAAKRAYETGLAFEDVLVGELAQQLAATVPGLDGSGEGTAGGVADSGGFGGGSSAQGSPLSGYASMLPGALTSAIMSGGGTGMAYQIAQALDPALQAPSKR